MLVQLPNHQKVDDHRGDFEPKEKHSSRNREDDPQKPEYPVRGVLVEEVNREVKDEVHESNGRRGFDDFLVGSWTQISPNGLETKTMREAQEEKESLGFELFESECFENSGGWHWPIKTVEIFF